MDKLDEIILSVLSDDGLCHRGKQKQAERRRKLRAAINAYMALELKRRIMGSQPVPSFPSGGICEGPQTAVIGAKKGPEYVLPDEQLKQAGVIIDEVQFMEEEKTREEITNEIVRLALLKRGIIK